jgi:hypothetical protein
MVHASMVGSNPGPTTGSQRSISGPNMCKVKDIESYSGYFGQCKLFIKIFGLDAIINRDFALKIS